MTKGRGWRGIHPAVATDIVTTCDPYVSCELEDREGAIRTGLGGSHSSFRPRNAEVPVVPAGARTVSRVAPNGEVGPRTRTAENGPKRRSGRETTNKKAEKMRAMTTKIAVRSTNFGVMQPFNPK